MSKLLISESPLQVLPSLAEEIGLNEAIVLQQLHYWLQRSGNVEEGEDGRTRRWVWKTLADWEEEFPFWSKSTIRRTLRSLKDDDLICAEKKRQGKGDTTVWYSVRYSALPDCSKWTPPSVQNEQTGCSEWTNGGVQNEQSRGAHNAGARSETTTTENTAESVGKQAGSAGARGDSIPDESVSVEPSEPSSSESPSPKPSSEPPSEENPFDGDPPDWLGGPDRSLAGEMEEMFEEFEPDPSHLRHLARKQWWRTGTQERQPTIRKQLLKKHLEEHPWPKIIAAYVVAADATRSPHKYADRILHSDRFDANGTRNDRTHSSRGSKSAGRKRPVRKHGNASWGDYR